MTQCVIDDKKNVIDDKKMSPATKSMTEKKKFPLSPHPPTILPVIDRHR